MFYTTNTTTGTSLLIHLQDIASYNLWAIQRLVNWLKTKDSTILEADASSSFPGIKATLVHIRDVEREWQGHLQQVVPPAFMRLVPEEESVANVLDSLEEQAALFLQYIEGLTEEELQEDCFCNLVFVGEICRPRFEIIQHCLNHSTYHRGQVVTIGHQLGLKDAPMTDFMFYALRVKEFRAHESKSHQAAPKSFLAVNFFSK
jgi:uncharacterized damage-inducible protein DinB